MRISILLVLLSFPAFGVEEEEETGVVGDTSQAFVADVGPASCTGPADVGKVCGKFGDTVGYCVTGPTYNGHTDYMCSFQRSRDPGLNRK